VYFIHLHCVLFYCNGGCGLSVLCNKEYDDDDDDLAKSNFIVFCSPKLRYDVAIANIMNHISLEQVQFAKFGVYIDERLSWHKHIQITASKISNINGILNKLHKYLPTFVILQLYNSLIRPYFTYCNCVSGTGSNSKFKSLITCQKQQLDTLPKFPQNSLITIL